VQLVKLLVVLLAPPMVMLLMLPGLRLVLLLVVLVAVVLVVVRLAPLRALLGEEIQKKGWCSPAPQQELLPHPARRTCCARAVPAVPAARSW
jgi:hypothetical protein